MIAMTRKKSFLFKRQQRFDSHSKNFIHHSRFKAIMSTCQLLEIRHYRSQKKYTLCHLDQGMEVKGTIRSPLSSILSNSKILPIKKPIPNIVAQYLFLSLCIIYYICSKGPISGENLQILITAPYFPHLPMYHISSCYLIIVDLFSIL